MSVLHGLAVLASAAALGRLGWTTEQHRKEVGSLADHVILAANEIVVLAKRGNHTCDELNMKLFSAHRDLAEAIAHDKSMHDHSSWQGYRYSDRLSMALDDYNGAASEIRRRCGRR